MMRAKRFLDGAAHIDWATSAVAALSRGGLADDSVAVDIQVSCPNSNTIETRMPPARPEYLGRTLVCP